MMSWLKAIVFSACLIPLAQLIYSASNNDLGTNPIETITRHTGSWALILLLVTLSVTPLRRIFHRNDLVKFRRMLGLFAFFYGTLHFATYIVLDHFFDGNAILKDILKRPYVTAGFTGFVLMVPLAITSTAGMIRRLGKHWQQLHRLVYIAAIAGVVHFYWLVKADIRRPAQYGAVLTLLLGYRLAVALKPPLRVPAGLDGQWAIGTKRSTVERETRESRRETHNAKVPERR
jgi:sulfoxide reductase heme-binding subunit YedZ